MSCTLTFQCDLIGVSGTPSAGINYINAQNTFPSLFVMTVPDGDYIAKWENIGTATAPGICPGVNQWRWWGESTLTGAKVNIRTSNTCHNIVFKGYTNSCPPVTTFYDCINGACLQKSQYNTPGIYSSLSACELACGAGCSGKCLSNSEWAQILGLAAQLKNKNCS